jgi:tetratricopeptide (TPR) repeat protein
MSFDKFAVFVVPLCTKIIQHLDRLKFNEQIHIKVFLQVQILFLFLFIADAQSASELKVNDCVHSFQKGITFFKKRDEGAKDWIARSENIDSAIHYFSNTIECPEYRQKSAYYLLRSYHFRAMYTDIPENTRKFFYNEGKVLGEKMIEEYPDDIDIKLWYLASAGKWIEYYGILRAAYEGIGPRIKKICEDIVRIDSLYENGIGFRILGLVYYRAPYIPYILPWPDKQKGIELTRKSLKINPDNIGNLLFMGRILYYDKQYDEAIFYFNKCLEQEPRKDYLIMERFDQMKAREFLNKTIRERDE